MLFAPLLTHAAGPAGTLPLSLQEWAILGTGPREQALCDLALTELSNVQTVTLIEREQIDKVLNELKLSAAMSADGTTDRLRLGKLLGADALAVVTITGEPVPKLRLVIADCHYGARLRVTELPWSEAAMPALAAHLANEVVAVQQQYAGGITRIYGVPGFVSHSLLRNYDPLQQRFSDLLQNILLLQPGVAVVEITEARRISQELALAGALNNRRVVPCFIEGDYRVESPTDTEPTITLTARRTDGDKTLQTFESGRIPLEAAAEWLTALVPKMVSQPDAKPLTPAQQALALLKRADDFARLGSLDYALPLRESALLIDPTQYKLQVEMVKEYCLDTTNNLVQMGSAAQFGIGMGKVVILDQKEDYRPYLACGIDDYLAALNHFDDLVRRRAITVETATDLIDALYFPTTMLLTHVSILRNLDEKSRPVELDKLADADRRQLLFLRDTYPLILELKYQTPMLEYHCVDAWATGMVILARDNLVTGQITRERLALIGHAFADRVPDANMYLPKDLPVFYSEQNRFASDLNEEDYLQFLAILRASGKQTLALYADYALLKKRAIAEEGSADAGLSEAVQQLIARYSALPLTNDMLVDGMPFYSILTKLRDEIVVKPVMPPATPPAVDTGAVRFEEIKITSVKSSLTPDDALSNGFRTVTACGENGDLVQLNSSFFMHTRPGELEEIVLGKYQRNEFDPKFQTMWDGRSIWAVTFSHGIFIIDPHKGLLKEITAQQGLPPYINGILLVPIAPGRVLAVGCYGTDYRAWCAMLTWSGNMDEAPVVNVFHEAKDVPLVREKKTLDTLTEAEARQIGLNANLVFIPAWYCVLRENETAPATRVLIGRNTTIFGANQPLLIDINTLKVQVFDGNFGRNHHPDQNAFYYKDGVLLGTWSENQVEWWLATIDLTKEHQDDKELYHLLRAANPKKDAPDTIDVHNGWQPLIPGNDGWLYVPGETWWRVNPKTLTTQRLTRDDIPIEYPRSYAYSSLFGIIAWDQYHVYRVIIDEQRIPQAD